MLTVKHFLIPILIICILVCFGTSAYAQYVPPKVPEKVCKNLDGAVLAADAGHTESAIENIKELIEKYPTWTNPRHSLSKIYYSMGKKKRCH